MLASYALLVHQASLLLAASFGFGLTTNTLAVQLTLPLAGCVGNFHPQVSAPCRAHKQKTRLDFSKRVSKIDPATSYFPGQLPTQYH